MRKRGLALCLVLMLVLALPGCTLRAPQRYTATWFDVFDTVTTLVGYASSQEAWDEQAAAVHADLLEYHKLYDIYHTYEELTNLCTLNEQAAQGPVAVDEKIMSLLVLAKATYAETDGASDIALGSVLELWHTCRTQAQEDPSAAALPDEDKLIAAGQHCKLESLVLDEQAGTVYYADEGLQLDVGSIGKGYAVEQVARAAQARGLTSALLSVGGNLRAIGTKPDGSPWAGGVENPWDTAADPVCVVELQDASLVTSGDYQRYYTVDGVRYHHIIDPTTLYPARYYSAVTVLCPDSARADALSTGLFCLPPEQSRAVVEGLPDVEAAWMYADGSIEYSSGFEAQLRAE